MREARGSRPPPRRPGGGGPQGAAPSRAPDYAYPVPPASAAAWRQHRRAAPQNPGLVFDRFAPDPSARPPASRAPTPKRAGLEAVVAAGRLVDRELLAAWNARWEAGAHAVGAAPFELATDWRLVTGVGQSSAFEVGFRFHRYGFPIVPGSSLKGLARTAGRLAVAAALDTEELTALETALGEEKEDACRRKLPRGPGARADEAEALVAAFRGIFGTTAGAGGAVFCDGIPAAAPTLELDIMNPHYPKYYRDQGPPVDWDSPNPVYFLTVAADTAFRFAVGWRLDAARNGQADERMADDGRGTVGPRDRAEWQALARAWLETGLCDLGAGAKTSAGYGYFVASRKHAEPATRPPARAARAADGAPSGAATGRRTVAAPSALPSAGGPAGVPAPPAARAATEPAAPRPPRIERRGTIVEIRPDLHRGRVRDKETGQDYRFDTRVVAGNTPGRRDAVVFELEGDAVVSLRRA